MTVAPPAARIGQLDFIRGLAVMGILIANLPAFGLPAAAYFSPLAWGGHQGVDLAAWVATFVLVEGKMRGLFSMLFGASMLRVIDRAVARGASPARVHFARMAVLLAIGLIHLYLIWWGDILAHYALVGAVAYLFVTLPPRLMLLLGIATGLVDVAMMGGMAATLFGSGTVDPAMTAEVVRAFGVPPRADLLAEVAAYRGSIASATAYRIAHAGSPIEDVYILGLQTLSAMLFGMAAYRSGFLTGQWSRRAYRRIAFWGIALTLPLYAAMAWHAIVVGFDYRWIFIGAVVLGPLVRPVTMAGYAALALLAFRPDGQWSARVAAAGRMAFSNYLGTSLLMLAIFTGGHLFGALSRAQLYWLAPLAWGLMLLWSKPWLDRFAYGPAEWLWRTASRGALQPFRKRISGN